VSAGPFLVAQLAATAPAVAVLGDRLYPVRRPQGATLPCAVYETVSAQRREAMSATTGMVRARVQVTFYGSTYDAVVEAHARTRAAWHRFRGTAGGVEIQDCFLDSEQSLYEDGTTEYGLTADYLIEYREA
jgi:hypothetical protein